MLTFRAFLWRRRPRNNPRGDLIRDIWADYRRFPDVQSWGELEMYLYSRSACDTALIAARDVWAEYERYQHSVAR